jgi:DNA-directed RNA polymerase subunit alpha
MSTFDIVIPSKPKIVREEGWSGIYEIDGLYPGYGHTLGNSLRRIILSSLPGAAVTKVKIKGADHEFSVLSGVKEDVITILLNLKRLRVRLSTDEPQILTLSAKGVKAIEHPGQVEILNPELYIADMTDKGAELDMEITVEKGLGYLSKEILHKDRVDVGAIALDASFSPIKKCNYEVENMRVGDRTDFNRLRLSIETDGTITAREAMEKSIGLMITQLKAIVGWKEEEPAVEEKVEKSVALDEKEKASDTPPVDVEFLKTRIDDIGLSIRTVKALSNANVRTVGGLARKKEIDILDIDGLGSKGIQEIKKVLAQYGISLK